MSDRIDVLGVLFDNVTMDEAVDRAFALQPARKAAYVVTPNPEIVMLCRDDPEAAAAVRASALTIPDGIGVVYGAKMLKTPLKERVGGCDFALRLMEKMDAAERSVFLLGGRPGVAEQAEEKLRAQFPQLRFVGTNDGYFTDDAPVIKKINSAAPDLLLVCLGAPKQELWMHRNAASLDVGVMIGAGGSLDVYAGNTARAPEGWRKAGLEWLYRLLKEPRRIGRMMSIPRFMLKVFAASLKRDADENDAMRKK